MEQDIFLIRIMRMKKTILVLTLAVFLLSGCSYFSWMNPWSDSKKEEVQKPVPSVNKYLWEASLQRLSFTPVIVKEPKAGVIRTDWFKMEGYPNELYQVEVKVLTKELRSEGLQVKVIKKVRVDGKWADNTPDIRLQSSIENKILVRARDLYRKDMFGK